MWQRALVLLVCTCAGTSLQTGAAFDEDEGPPYLIDDEECVSVALGNCGTGATCGPSGGSCSFLTVPTVALPNPPLPPVVDIWFPWYTNVPVPVAIPTSGLMSVPWPHDQCVARADYGCWINNELPVVPCRQDWQTADTWCWVPVCMTVGTVPPYLGTKLPEY